MRGKHFVMLRQAHEHVTSKGDEVYKQDMTTPRGCSDMNKLLVIEIPEILSAMEWLTGQSILFGFHKGMKSFGDEWLRARSR